MVSLNKSCSHCRAESSPQCLLVLALAGYLLLPEEANCRCHLVIQAEIKIRNGLLQAKKGKVVNGSCAKSVRPEVMPASLQ